jgi:replicative DNA helicase
MRPSDTETERLAIGTVLRYPDTVDELIKLSEHDFDNLKMRRYYQILRDMQIAGNIDSIVFRDKAGIKASELLELQNNVISGAFMPSYVNKLRNLSKRRAIQEAAQMLIDKAENNSLDIDELMAEAARKIEDVAVSERKEPEELIKIAERRIDNLMSEKGLNGITTGLADLDRNWAGFFPGELTILAARPSMGKTAFAQYLAGRVAKETGLPSLVFSIEMSSEYLADRFIATSMNTDVDLLRRGYVGKKQLENKYKDVLLDLAGNNIYIQDDSEITTYDVKAQTRKMLHERGVGLVVVDFLTLLSDDKERGDTEALKIAAIVRRLRKIGKELKVPMLILAQLNRGVDKRDDKHPIMSDLKESGGIEEAADNILFLYRENYYDKELDDNTTEIIIEKQKQGPRGITAYCIYDPSTGRWLNKSERTPPAVMEGGKQWGN